MTEQPSEVFRWEIVVVVVVVVVDFDDVDVDDDDADDNDRFYIALFSTFEQPHFALVVCDSK